jgi:hypothetical protein
MSSEKATLHYFNGRGRAEIIRLTMASAGIEVNILNNNYGCVFKIFNFYLKWNEVHLFEVADFQKLKDGKNKVSF